MTLVVSCALAFLAIGGGLFFLREHRCRHYYRRLLRTALMRPYSPGADVEFRWRMSGSGTTKDGARFDDSEYESTDCVPVSVIYFTFPSSDTAVERVDGEIRSARTILSKDTNAQTNAAERIVLFTHASAKYEVLHRTDNRLLLIESPSISHALEYEKRLFDGATEMK